MVNTVSTTASAPGETAVAATPLSPLKRLVSLDMLRGITIAFMIMVNNNGGDHAWAEMHHAAWNGFTATDLVFPTFLFVVGVSIVFATEARLARGQSRGHLAWHTVRRACILFAFGIVVNNYPLFHLEHMRFYGVLPRIAICYLVVELFYLWDRRASTKVLALVLVLLGYWALVRLVPVPGAGVPGRDVPLLDKDQNIVAWLDRQLMPGHLYEDSPLHNARDPEGLLSSIPSLATALLGVLTGLWLSASASLQKKATWLLVAALCGLALGKFWALWFPINKKLWTSSFVLFAAGATLLVLAICFFLVEVRQWKRARTFPWIVFGSNAIVAYIFSELLAAALFTIHVERAGQTANLQSLIYDNVFSSIVNPSFGSLLYSLAYVAVCFVPVAILYRKRMFIKI